jgi:uncharacterized membrane protein
VGASTGAWLTASRLESFSDSVLAIIITIMVLQLDMPTQHDFDSFLEITGNGLVTYLLSFVIVGTYWINHHHIFHGVRRVGGAILWTNLALLFCLSLLPFTTEWLEESNVDRAPVFIYGLNLMLNGAMYFLLQRLIIRQEGPNSLLKRAVGHDIKGKVSQGLYLVGLACVLLVDPHGTLGAWLALACYIGVAVMWAVPDRRIDRLIEETETR